MLRPALKFGFAFCLLFFLMTSPAGGYDAAGHDCAKCHKLTNDEAQNVIKEVIPKEAIPELKIIEVRPQPVKGLWEIAFEAKGRKGIIYLDFAKERIIIIQSGGLFDIKTKTNLTGERLSYLTKVDVSKIPLNEALLMGDKNAAKKIIVFTDPD